MAELIPTDEFLVNRNNTTYTQEQGTLMANLEATDKLLVNRSDKTYTITGQEFIDSVVDPLSITVTLAPTSGYVGTPVTATAVVSGGKEPDGGYQFNYQWYLADDLAGTNASIILDATNQSYEPVEADIDSYLGCTVSTTDLFGNTATDTAYIGPIGSLNSAPVIDSVTLTETGDGSARFTSQTFAYDTVMSNDGNPAPQYSLKAKLSGSTFDFSTKSDTITDVDNIVVPGGWNAVPAAEDNNWYSVTYGADKFVAVANNGTNRVMYSDDGIIWKNDNVTGVEANNWGSVTYGNGKFVAVEQGRANRVMYSTDGITWTAVSATEANDWQSVTYGNGKFVAVAADGTNRVMYSTNGISWISASAAEANGWKSVTYGNGKFVAVAGDGTNRVMHSSDGINWTAASATEANSWSSVTYGNGKFVAVEQGWAKRVMYSTDGINWISATAAEANGWQSVTYGNGKFVAVASAGSGTNRVMHSTDGINWTAVSAAEDNGWRSVAYGNGKFVAVTSSGTNRVMWSTTGTDSYDATTLTYASDAGLADIDAVGGEVYMTDGSIELDGSYAKSSYTPVTSNIAAGGVNNIVTTGGWNAAAAAAANNWKSVTYGNGKFVATATDGTDVMYSEDDGLTWTATPATSATTWWSVTYGNGKFVAVADSGTNRVMHSPDGITWTAASAAEASHWVSVTYGNGKFVAVARGGTNRVMHSPDGITWTAASAAEANTWQSVTYSNGRFVAVSEGGTNRAMYSDDDGLTWTAASVTVGQYYGVTYGNDKFVAVGNGGGVMYSTDGITWTEGSVYPETDNLRSVTYGNGKFVAVAKSGTNRVMWSTDGISWTSALAADGENWHSVTYGNGKFVAVSETGTNRVMWSYTGTDEDESSTELTFEEPCVDLQYFEPGDKVEGLDTPATRALTPAFSTTLYEGDNTNSQIIPTGVDNTGKSLVWIKNREKFGDGTTYSHQLYDTLRGPLNVLYSDRTEAESELAVSLIDFKTNGFEVGANSYVNYPDTDFVAWNFRAAPGFFDVVTYEGNSAADTEIPHNLGTNPGVVIVKDTSGSTSWIVWHKDIQQNDTSGDYLQLNATNLKAERASAITKVTDSKFTVGTWGNVNKDGNDFVAYLFADNPAGGIKCGSGRVDAGGEANVFTVDVGFTIGWLLIKQTEVGGNWKILDLSRGIPDTYSGIYSELQPNTNGAELSVNDGIYVTDGTVLNFGGGTGTGEFIYVAIAEGVEASGFPPTGIVTEANPDSPTMSLGNTRGDWTTQVGLPVSGPTNTADGTWDSYTGTDATVSSVNGRWIGANSAGTNFSIAPKDGLVSTVNEAYANLQIVNDKARVNSIQADDPGFMNVTAQDYTIEFPSLFATGNEPDVDLPAGTSISAIVKAENEIGESIVESNTVMPSLPNPEGAAGHITATTTTELTVASSLNLDGFVANDSLVMVDDTGAVTSYTPETSAIDTTVDIPGGWNAVAATEANTWKSVTYGANKFVAVASNGTNRVMHSPDGLTWTAASAPGNNEWQSVTYGNNKFVAIAPSGTNRVMHSDDDGLTWTAASAAVDNAWRSVTYGNNKFVAVSSDGSGTNRVMHSPDGITWTAASATEANDWRSVTYANGKFVAVASSGTNRVMHSPDGISWTAASAAENNDWFSVAYGADKFVAVGYGGTNRVMYSADGLTWTSAAATEANSWFSVTYGNGKFVAVSYDGTTRVMHSPDGINWTVASAAEANNWYSVIYGNDKFVAVAGSGTNRVMWSTTGADGYTELTFDDNQDLNNFKSGDKVEAVSTTTRALTPAFSTTTYTGNGSGSTNGQIEVKQTIDTGIDNTDKSLVWIKSRTEAYRHYLVDSERTIGDTTDGLNIITDVLVSNETFAELPRKSSVMAFTSNGFDLGDEQDVNYSGKTYVAWNFRAAPGFFDIVTYEGTGVGTTDPSEHSVSHSLGSEPGFIIIKVTSGSSQWYIYHKELGEDCTGYFTTSKFDCGAGFKVFGDINDKTFGVKGSGDSNNSDYVAYLFADTPGKIKCGGYGKISTFPHKVSTGFKVGWLMIRSAGTGSWQILDSKRPNGSGLAADGDYQEYDYSQFMTLDPSDGFTCNTSDSNWGDATNDFIYIAIAEGAQAGDFLPTGIVTEADPDGPTMSLSNTTGDWTAEVGSKVAGPEKSGVGTFVSTNGTDTITIQNSNNEWCSTGRNGEQFYAIKEFTALNANDPKHVEMSQAIAAAFAAFPQNVNARRTSIASSFYRLMGGETLTAEETDLLTSTVLNAVNAVEPFALDGYYPLYYTAEAANAASSVDDHHTHDINGETFYMPDGGTIYHGTYVTPEETEETSGY